MKEEIISDIKERFKNTYKEQNKGITEIIIEEAVDKTCKRLVTSLSERREVIMLLMDTTNPKSYLEDELSFLNNLIEELEKT